MNSKLPESWIEAPLNRIAEINPKLEKSSLDDDLEVSFVPMSAVEAETGAIDISETRCIAAVKKGYTAFREGDVLFAKITPCMENGKMAVVPAVKSGHGFGSTEFHVLRPYHGISAEYVYYFVSSQRFRYDAEHNMSGAVGQRRVPTSYLGEHLIPVAPVAAQKRIVTKIEELFSGLDKGVESLKTAQEQLKVYRQAVLKHAFEGKLTVEWRIENRSKLEAPEQLLARIRKERVAHFDKQLEEWKAAVAEWEKHGKVGKRPAKPRAAVEPDKPHTDQLRRMWELPDSWQWLQIGSFCFVTKLAGFEYTKFVKYDDEGDLSVIKAENAGPNGYRVTDYSRIVSTTVQDLKRSHLHGGELLMVFVGAGTGNVATVPMDRKYFLGPNIGMIRPDSSSISSRYIELFLRSPYGKELALASVKAVAQPSLSMGTIRQIPVALPCYAEQIKIVELLDEKLSSIDAMDAELSDQIAKSDALRQSILKKAFSGQLVPQDAKDEPASMLLERIRTELNAEPSRLKRKKAAA